MPYVDQETRTKIGSGMPPTGPGELNYKLTMLLLTYVRAGMRQPAMVDCLFDECKRYITMNGLSYQRINDVLGACTGASMELRRRSNYGVEARLLVEVAQEFYEAVAAPYEDRKIVLNGDLPYSPT